MKKRYLVLQDGTVFEGYAFGAETESVGELIFSTKAVGYIETLTDPAYFGQIVVQTFPLIGNYGIIEEDFIGQAKLHGYVVREHCQVPSNFRCEYTLDTFLKNNGIPGIYGVDTREITNILRDGGMQNAKICDEIPADFEEIKNFKIVSAVANTTSKETKTLAPDEKEKMYIALLDLGATKCLEKELCEKGAKVTVLPAYTKAEEILSLGADAVVLSEGAGDPNENGEIIETVKTLMDKTVVFGVGLGHQLMALSQGAETEKLSHGHHASNMPVKIVGTPKAIITSQNHNYTVKEDTVKNGKISHRNCNDATVEGIEYSGKKAASVQFEVSADYIMCKIEKMKEEK